MRKFLLCLLAGMLICSMTAGCAQKSAIEGMDFGAPLVTVGGTVVMTVEDFWRSLKEQEVSQKIKGTETQKEKDLFLEKAELRILSYYAEQFGLSTDEQFLSEEYDAHIIEIEDTSVYGKEKEFFDALQQELGMSDEEYKIWNVRENLIQYNVSNLMDDLVDTYKYVTDPIYMEELALENLYALVDMAEIEFAYPGVKKEDLSFEKILSL